MQDRRQSSPRRLLKSRNLQRSLAFALAAGFWLTTAPAAQAAGDTLDQSQLVARSSLNVASTGMMAQTFKAGLSGQLDKLSLFVGQQFITGGGTIQVESVAGGTPSGSSLGGAIYSGQINPAWRDFPLNPAVSVTAGTQYAIVIIPTSGSGNTSWGASVSPAVPYAAGQLMSGVQATGAWTNMTMSAAFETWVATGTNSAPVVAAGTAAVSVNEGATASNSGTYSDADGDTVTLSASAGTLTKTGISSGTWSWTQTAGDEGTGQTITITANDGNGNVATATFSTTVAGVAPTATITGAPASDMEGTTVALTGSATSPSTGETFTYGWTVTKDGLGFASGTGAAFSFMPDNEGTYVVTLKATDDGGFSGTATATFNGMNALPTDSITNTIPSTAVMPTETVTFSGHFSDPGTGDTHTATWNFGDAATSTASFAAGGTADFTASHAYAKAGTYTVGLTVTDDDGGTSTAATTIAVGGDTSAAILNVEDLVTDLPGLKRWQQNSLVRKLESARRWIQRGKMEAACDQLDSFLHRVETQVDDRHLTSDDAATLAKAVQAIELSIGCNRNNDDFGDH